MPFFLKCIFRAEKGIFSKSSFYTKMFSDPKYSFSVCQKNFFLIQSKVNIFHQIQPMHSPCKIIHQFYINHSSCAVGHKIILWFREEKLYCIHWWQYGKSISLFRQALRIYCDYCLSPNLIICQHCTLGWDGAHLCI